MKHLILPLLLCCAAPLLRAEIAITPQAGCLCAGAPRQAFAVEASGTAGPFTFRWEGPEGYVSEEQNPQDMELPGAYTLYVTNAYGCTFAYPQEELPACEGPGMSIEANHCEGALALELEGGAAPFEIYWYIDGQNEALPQQGAYLASLPPGHYFAKLIDALGCYHATETVELLPAPDALAFDLAVTPASCAAAADASIAAAVSGGSAPYSFSWFSVQAGANILLPGESSAELQGLSPGGVYRVKAVDAMGCSSVSEEIAVGHVEAGSQPFPFLYQVEVWAGFSGAAELVYSANWQADAAGCWHYTKNENIQPGQSVLNAIAQGAPLEARAWSSQPLDFVVASFPGTGVTPALGADLADGVSWSFVFEEGLASLINGNAISQGLSFSGIAAGEQPKPLLDMYAHSGGLASCVEQPAQASDCTWQPEPKAGQDPSHLLVIEGCALEMAAPGGTCPKITAASGCGAADGGIRFIDFNCITGASPYSFSWSNGATTSSLDWIEAGSYQLTITDAQGCQGVFSFEVPGVGTPQYESKVVNSCQGLANGSISLALIYTSSGPGPSIAANFEWSAAGTITGDEYFNVIEGLAPGEYCVTVTSIETGCSKVDCYTIVAESPAEPLALAAEALSPVCHNASNGTAAFEITGGLPPYHLDGALLDEAAFQLSSFSAGVHCPVATDHCGAQAQACFEIETVEGSAYSLSLAAIQHVSSPGAADGAATVQVFPPGAYHFEWLGLSGASGSSVSGLSPGYYTVRVWNMGIPNSCSKTLQFQIKGCEDADSFSLHLSGGLAMPGDSEVELYALISGGGLPFSYLWIPEGWAAAWSLNGQPLGLSGNPISLSLADAFALSANPVVELSLSNGCETKTAQRPIFQCGNSAGAADFFIAHAMHPCEGGTDGQLFLAIPDLYGQSEIEAFLTVHGGSQSPLPLQAGGGIEQTVGLGGLEAGSYAFTIVIDGCTTSFTYDLQPRQNDISLHSFDSSTETCVFEESCGGLHQGFFGMEPALDFANGSTNPCRVPFLCQGEAVGHRNYPKRTCRGIKYKRLLQFMRNTPDIAAVYGEAYLDWLIQESLRLPDCNRVRFCTGNMQRISNIGAGGSATFQNFTNDGCERWVCSTSLLGTGFKICPDDDCFSLPNLSTDPNNPTPASECNQIRSFNFYGLLHAYQEGWFDDLADFWGSSLHDALAALAAMPEGEQQKAKCAEAHFCLDDYELFFHTMDEVSCLPIVLTNITLVYNDPEEGLDGGVYYEYGDDIVIPTCETIEAIWSEDGNLVSEVVRCRSGACASGGGGYYPNDCSMSVVIDYRKLANMLGIDPPGLTDGPPLAVKRLDGPFQAEELARFSYLSAEGLTIPKGILHTETGKAYYDFFPGPGIEIKSAQPGLEHQIEDWDAGQDVLIMEAAAGGKNIIYEDSLHFWVKVLHSSLDTTLSIENAVLLGSGGGIELAGLFTGQLFLGEEFVASSEQAALFSMQLAADGELLGVMVSKNVEGGLEAGSFSRDGSMLIVAELSPERGDLTIGQTIVAPPADKRGKLLAKWDASSRSFAAMQQLYLPAGVSIQASAQQGSDYAMLAKNAGSIIPEGAGAASIELAEGQSLLASMSLSGAPAWTAAISGAPYLFPRILYTPDGGLLVGLTITGNIEVAGQSLASIGGLDVALLQFSPSGHLAWAQVYGTAGDETVEQLFYDGGQLYFGGRFHGEAVERQIGDFAFRDYEPYGVRAYISSVAVAEPIQPLRQPALSPHGPLAGWPAEQGLALMAVYPNPSSGEINLSLQAASAGSVDISLADLHGREVQSWPGYPVAEGLNRFAISPSASLPPGLYLLKIASGGGQRAIMAKITRF
jgi:uncharacterized protein (DUF2141 family)